MKSSWLSLFGLLVATYAAQATHIYYSKWRCECNGRSQYCLPDAVGLHCLDCQGNTEGRHCERCKEGFYLQGHGCERCHCHPAGSVSAACDQSGRCSCREPAIGDKCDQCPDGPITGDGCPQRRRLREDSGLSTSACFCYGHSSQCSPTTDYSIHNVTSTFDNGPEDWTVATMQGITPLDTRFRWSPKHMDMEVISKNNLPIYLYAPGSYLGNQLLSYGQNLSFSLHLDRGIRYPSSNDVILEGAGLRVGTSLGDLRFNIPCGKKINYSFRLDENPSSGWSPRLTPFQFQTLLQNLTTIKIRATFGENGRGYLDNVELGSAARGAGGVPAHWVQTCSCPQGFEGDFCERCSAGFSRSLPQDGAFSPCRPCSCPGGSCDPKTGDCYPADEIPGDLICSGGFYRHPTQANTCVKCPCPTGVSCSLDPGSSQPRCHDCPTGTTGFGCNSCEEGFYADPVGSTAGRPSCKPCQCNGHIDSRVAGSCDSNGKCLKCLNNTTGQNCESCIPGYYHRQASHACKPCNCHPQSDSDQCDDGGQCKCRPGFEGLKCQWSSCPSCFSPIKEKMEVYSDELKKLVRRGLLMDGDLSATNTAKMEAALREAEDLVNDMQDNAELLTELERKLIGRQLSISKSQKSHEKEIQNIADGTDDLQREHQKYKLKQKQVQTLIDEMESKLDEAKNNLRRIEVPLGDASPGSNLLSSLKQAALSLADKHETTAVDVDRTSSTALSDSEKGLDLVKKLVNRENNVKGTIDNLKKMLERTPVQVKALEKRAISLAGEAKDESKAADGMLKEIAKMEKSLPSVLQDGISALVSRMDKVKEKVDENPLDNLLEDVQQKKDGSEVLLATGKAAEKEVKKLKDRVDVAKDITENALKNFNLNTKELDSALDTLRGFDQQIDISKDAADNAIKRLPKISGTIKQASKSNDQTLAHLDTVSGDYNDALGTINTMEDLVNNLEKTFGSLPSHDDLLNKATKLNREAQELKNTMTNAAAELTTELDEARRLQAHGHDASVGAAAAFRGATQARDAVGKTLLDVNNLLANLNVPGVAVDEKHLQSVEKSLADAQREVEGRLRPKLRDMEQLEAAQNRRLVGLDHDITAILADILNLKEILESVPKGCYNSPPSELP